MVIVKLIAAIGAPVDFHKLPVCQYRVNAANVLIFLGIFIIFSLRCIRSWTGGPENLALTSINHIRISAKKLAVESNLSVKEALGYFKLVLNSLCVP